LTFQALKESDADGVLIARGALGNPWIFAQIEEMIAGKNPTPVSLEERIATIKQHVDFHIEQYSEGRIPTFRKHLSWYFRGINGAKKYKLRLHTTSTRLEVHAILDEMLADGLEDEAVSTRDAVHPDAATRTFMSK